MSDEELDRRVADLSEADLREAAAGGWCDLAWRRSLALRVRMASEVLRLRAELAEQKRLNLALAERRAGESGGLVPEKNGDGDARPVRRRGSVTA